ncbi:GNAT family N-acetyltransferase [Streptomyces sp. NPDC101249]|jgi:ribosomal protein S18 acetylase RimI-like enzyme|uniref:GNAT family N-acetyltransferase n=1 Tax=unclassified Streptomyces TaxID=2593676 RepID=UPI00381AE48A
MNYVIRSIRAAEWPAVKDLRLAALQDPVAHLAFLDSYDEAVVRSDSFWQERAEGACEGAEKAQQFVGIAADGVWAGTATVLLEEPGTTDWAGNRIEHRQGHVVGVYVRPEHRGKGLSEALFEAGTAWAQKAGVERMRLIVHEDNLRAQGLYRKLGFKPSGVTVPLGKGTDEAELEYVLERPV